MKKSNTLFIAIYVILTICSADLYAQIALYVSKQTNEFTQHSGSDSKTTDKYEHGTVTINLNPSSDCPITYTLTPNDFSINVNETKSWQGVVKPDLSHIPTPGTSANASINGDYDVHFSRPEGGSGGSIEGGYDCGKCPVHTSGGHHDLIHKTGTITKDFVVHSVLVDIPDSIPCNDGIATLNATYYPAGGTLEWTTPSGTLTGNNLSYTLPTPLTDNIIRVKYTIYGVSYSDTGYVRIAKLTGFNLPCCADTTQVVKDIAELTFDGVCHPKIKYTPDTVEQPALLPYYTYTVTAIDSNSGVSLTDTIVIVNKNQALSVTPLAADFTEIRS
ncbi:MAG: hypothetical protein HGB12_13650, partial [Bacteroidetes bacterium]|nr:hypothetical protein [Bacteroidota bacterium]